MGQRAAGAGSRWRRRALAGVVLSVAPLLIGACTSAARPSAGVVQAVAAENFYADVLRQIGGPDVRVSSVVDNPNIDPHSYELRPSVARAVAGARLVVQNGLGYDDFMDRIESASPSSDRRTIVVQHLLGLTDGTPNPHLWYDPATMPKVAAAMAGALAALSPGHASLFRANLARFDASLGPLTHAVASFAAAHRGTPVATTEPVADYLLEAMGADNRTPFRFQVAVMNGVDPAPQDITLEHDLLTGHRVRLFCYNEQVVDALTSSIRRAAVAAGIPVVGVSETMPAGTHYQRWMLAEVLAIARAVSSGTSTEHR